MRIYAFFLAICRISEYNSDMRNKCILMCLLLLSTLSITAQTVEDIATVHYLNGLNAPTYDIQVPTPSFYISRGLYRVQKEHDFKNGSLDFAQGLKGYSSSLYYRYSFLANSVLIIMWAAIAALYASIIILSLRTHKPILFKTLHSYFSHDKPFLIKILTSLGVFIFFLLGGWIYFFVSSQGIMKKKEIVLLLCLTILAAVPMSIISLFPQFYAYIHEPALLKQLSLYDNYQIEYIVRDELKEIHARIPSAPLPSYLLAKYYKGATTLYKDPNGYAMALAYYDEMITMNFFPEVAYTNIGNIHFINGDTRSALASYEKAITANPNNAYALYNLSQWHLFKGNDDTYSEYYSKALTQAKKSHITLPETAVSSITIFDAEIPKNAIWSYHIHSMFAMSGVDVLFSTQIMIILIMFPTILLLIGLVLARSNINFRPYIQCASCTTPLFPNSARATYMNNTLCPDCSMLVSQESYSADVTSKRKRQYFFSWIKSCILNLMLPGSGFLYSGYTLRGIIFLLISIILLLPHMGIQFVFFPSIIDDMVFQALFPLYYILQISTILWSSIAYIRIVRRKNG